ncbi:serine/threonine/tyrosine-interacting protein, putative [Entamoeba dispar SAW760]|uniref:protein-tyrosine-phosphatase n=1 Tax=Entamoeba dispar (strain ATCC PRA-260 / SAW760) TaxID=370354 RepID=B0E610_ENTDS|nr:serine/threonine/tyrosine-interacting protein, putative [Entamoeba dispar SAW760]EDR30047.1 serine/threonine/tyrosine-interacting protein, putative [Entamoeba dispar SAW760]|eukprot:EDR30047.1 serine/threonine/tyrosine-interacting protein, putative [Entamoeba dispar SAW760]
MGNKPSRPSRNEIQKEVQKVSEILPNLFLTSRITAMKPNIYREYDISAVLSLTTNNINYPDGVISKHLHIQDSFFFLLQKSLEESIEFIEEMMKEGRKVLVHCEVGMSRSASAVIAFLMKSNDWCIRDAYLYTKERREIICPNPGFIIQLYEFQLKLGIKDSKSNRLFVRDLLDRTNSLYREIPTYALWNAFVSSGFSYEKAIKDQPRMAVVNMNA